MWNTIDNGGYDFMSKTAGDQARAGPTPVPLAARG